MGLWVCFYHALFYYPCASTTGLLVFVFEFLYHSGLMLPAVPQAWRDCSIERNLIWIQTDKTFNLSVLVIYGACSFAFSSVRSSLTRLVVFQSRRVPANTLTSSWVWHAVGYLGLCILQVTTGVCTWYPCYPSSVVAGSYPFVVSKILLEGVDVAPSWLRRCGGWCSIIRLISASVDIELAILNVLSVYL